jgi:UDPglucose--hexose-1-phosphate uridylyltransferase
MKKPESESELRKHYFLESYVIIAPGRKLRPDSFAKNPRLHTTPPGDCPFDKLPGRGVWQTPRTGPWSVKVIPNKYPALTLDNPQAFGVQEVIINTPDHKNEFSDLSIAQIQEVFAAYRNRLTELAKHEGIRYVLIFKNDGPVAGASVAHAHCQVFALPIVPPKIARESDAMNHYWDTHNTCAYCDLIAWEIGKKVRVITEDKHFIAIAPYSSTHALEVWVLPKRHVGKFTDLHHAELHSLAVIMKKITARLDSTIISFNYILQESLDNQDHHFVLKVEPRTTKYAGAELGTGVIINPIAPEYAALWYQGKVKD